jgi:deoxyribodipyrimidine photo-lyase
VAAPVRLSAVRTAIVLFTRDLRVHDNPALSIAARDAERVVPLFVFDDGIMETAFARPNRISFLLDALRDLDASLAQRGARLVLRSGDVVEETVALARDVKAEAVFVAEDASGYAQRREQRLQRACRDGGIVLRRTPGVTVMPLGSLETSSGSHYSVFTPFYRAWSDAPWRPAEPTPRRLSIPSGVSRGRLPTLDALVDGNPSPELPPGGETAGRRRLAAWLRRSATHYDARRDDLAATATSRLSPYLHFGCLSPLEVAQRAADVAPFVRQLAWRDFFHQLLAARPETVHEDLHPRGTRWSGDGDALEAWKNGETGYPIVDAGMRQLRREGAMHNRARLITASFLVHHLHVDWRAGARHFFDWLVDGDVANNVGNWQWVAGTGANPRRGRPLSPLRQALASTATASTFGATCQSWLRSKGVRCTSRGTSARSALATRSRSSTAPEMPTRFPFRFDPVHRRLARPFGVTPERAWVDVGEAVFEARYGRWCVRTPLSNIAAARVTGPYSLLKTAGPARLAFTDRGLTFASNGDRGVCITFHSPVAGIDRAGRIRHPELTVTVVDVDGLVAALQVPASPPRRTV